MTRNEALQIVTETINACDLSIFNDEQLEKLTAALGIVTTMRDKLSTPRQPSEAAKAKAAEKRANEVSGIIPIVRKAMEAKNDMTAQEVFDACTLPAGWTKSKIVALFGHELQAEIEVTERKGKPNLYRLK